MVTLLAVVIGALYAGALYMMTRRSIVKLIIGLAMLSHAANLLIFTVAGLRRRPPLVPLHSGLSLTDTADPLPQALVLTAIVISFGVLAFTLALVHRTFRTTGSDDLDRIRTAEQ